MFSLDIMPMYGNKFKTVGLDGLMFLAFMFDKRLCFGDTLDFLLSLMYLLRDRLFGASVEPKSLVGVPAGERSSLTAAFSAAFERLYLFWFTFSTLH